MVKLWNSFSIRQKTKKINLKNCKEKTLWVKIAINTNLVAFKKNNKTQHWRCFLWIEGTEKMCRRPPMSGSVGGDRDRKGGTCSYLSGRIMPGLTGIIMGRGWRIMCGGPGIICIGPPIGGLMPPKCHGEGEHGFRFGTFGIEAAWKYQRSECFQRVNVGGVKLSAVLEMTLQCQQRQLDIHLTCELPCSRTRFKT